MIRRGLTEHETPNFSLCNGTSCIALGFSSLYTHWTFGPPLFHKLGYTRRCENWRARKFTTKLTDTFSVSFFLAKDSTINTRCSTSLQLPPTDTSNKLQRHGQITSWSAFISANDSFCYRALTSAICEKYWSAMWQNNQQRIVFSQAPRSQFLRFLSLEKPKGKSTRIIRAALKLCRMK
jgi:hypothetical protein